MPLARCVDACALIAGDTVRHGRTVGDGVAPGRAHDRAVQRGARAVPEEQGQAGRLQAAIAPFAAELDAARDKIGAMAARAYIGGQTDEINAILAAKSPGEVCVARRLAGARDALLDGRGRLPPTVHFGRIVDVDALTGPGHGQCVRRAPSPPAIRARRAPPTRGRRARTCTSAPGSSVRRERRGAPVPRPPGSCGCRANPRRTRRPGPASRRTARARRRCERTRRSIRCRRCRTPSAADPCSGRRSPTSPIACRRD